MNAVSTRKRSAGGDKNQDNDAECVSVEKKDVSGHCLDDRSPRSSPDKGKQPWPLYVGLGGSPTPQQAADDDILSASSGYIPSTSSYSRQSNSSSPLSFTDDSCTCDELEDSIRKAEQHALSFQIGGQLPPRVLDMLAGSPNDHTKRSRGTTSGGDGPTPRCTLFTFGCDLMAEIFSFLPPSDTVKVLTYPLCREWYFHYTKRQELWRILCLMKPFNADLSDLSDISDSSSVDSSCASVPYAAEANDVFGKYRLMYTSFVRCVKYLEGIKDDAKNGRTPSVIDHGRTGFPHFGASRDLKSFLARRGVSREAPATPPTQVYKEGPRPIGKPIGVSDEGYQLDQPQKRKATQSAVESKKPKFGNSMITARLLGPSAAGDVGHLNLPSPCAIYSIVNWMVAFPDVVGIQTKCIDTLPCLLENEQQRMTAQRVGLVEVILRAMLRFPDDVELHTTAFHTMVLLARPLGGQEGMIFDNSMAISSAGAGLLGGSTSLGATAAAASAAARHSNANGLLPGRSNVTRLNGFNGFAVMIDSMRRFLFSAKLQAAACWAMVNFALVPAQKTMIISLDGVQAMLDAMTRHPYCFDVQYRALFALINLVSTSTNKKLMLQLESDEGNPRTEKDVLDENIGEIVGLVVLAMKNFCSSEIILNRACLVLHNLSQTRDYLTTILWTPHCYQMLEWCIRNHPTDRVLRRAAISALHRLQVLLTGNRLLRRQFEETLQAERDRSVQRSKPVGQHL